MAQSTGQGLLVIERILRDRDSIWRQVIEERGLKRLTLQMLASSAISLACYGAVLGASHSFGQAISSAIKLPLLFLATLAICLPTLYLFNLLFGARLQMMQAVALIMVSITVTAVLTPGLRADQPVLPHLGAQLLVLQAAQRGDPASWPRSWGCAS